MNATEAIAVLEAEGLRVSADGPDVIQVYTRKEPPDAEVPILVDAVALLRREGDWLAVLPATGLRPHHVHGDLGTLVALLSEIYRSHRASGGDFVEAVERHSAVRESERVANGRLPRRAVPMS